MIYGSIQHDYAGRKRKQPKARGEVYGKYTPPKFSPMSTTKPQTYADVRRAEAQQYPSRDDFTIRGGEKRESQKYTGDYVIGIATMHKSNAVPVTNGAHATDISRMRR